MKVYKHKDNNHYYIVYKVVNDTVYFIEWDGQDIRYWRNNIRLFHLFKKYLKPVSKLKSILIMYEIQKFDI